MLTHPGTRTRSIVHASLLAAVPLLLGLGAAQVGGCSQSGSDPGNGASNGAPGGNGSPSGPGSQLGTGNINVDLTISGGEVLDTLTYDLLGPSGTPLALPVPNPGTISIAHRSAISFQLGGVPTGAGDSISLTAPIVGGGICQGSTSGFTVVAGGTTYVNVQMFCTLPGPDAGNVAVSGQTYNCGTWTGLSTNGSEAYVGESVILTATGTGPAPSSLGYTWTMSNPIGALGAIQPDGGVGSPGQDEGVGPSDPMSFLCTSPGTTTISVVVDDGPLPVDAGAACPASLNTITTTVKCDAYPSNQVEAAWVELTGPNGRNGLTGNVAIARAVTAFAPTTPGANPCPSITIDNGTAVQMNLRAAASTSIPSRPVNTAPGVSAAAIIGGAAAGGPGKPALFPVSSCEYPLPGGTASAVINASLNGQPTVNLPVPKANPQRVVIIGDTGCRLQTDNGTQSCNDADPNGTDTPYPFATIAELAAAQHPDLVIHVGDYAYRDNECPAGLGFNCGGSPWGFGWDTWDADLFTPAAPLMAAAPWIMTRGNHEQCNRAGQGWYRFLDPQPFDTAGVHTCDNPAYDDPGTTSNATTANTSCPNYGVYGNCSGNFNNPYLVQINASTQIVVFDTANAKPQSQALNPSFGMTLPTGSSSLPTGSTSVFFATYASELATAGSLVSASPLPFNLWSNHHPIFGYATGAAPTNPIPAFVAVMNSVFPGTYFPASVNLAVHGHTHDYQAIDFQTGTLPDGGTFQPAATLVSGNTGDVLDTALPYPLTGSSVSAVGNPAAVSVATIAGVQQFATSDNAGPYANTISAAAAAAGDSPSDNDFGYMELDFTPATGATPATWASTEFRADNTVRDVCTVQTSGQMSCSSWGVILANDAGIY
jgi:hypothetical protein